jgi:hypothetical protein
MLLQLGLQNLEGGKMVSEPECTAFCNFAHPSFHAELTKEIDNPERPITIQVVQVTMAP